MWRFVLWYKKIWDEGLHGPVPGVSGYYKKYLKDLPVTARMDWTFYSP
jgi:hypothetical protein